MEPVESINKRQRKRTESNGGNSSDSDLSDGWNIIDPVDSNGQDLPSSDGESVEVIDAEDDSQDEPELKTTQDIAEPECPVDEPELAVIPHVEPTNQEENTGSSLNWFLLVAIAGVLTSNLFFLTTENFMDWRKLPDTNNIGSPSFLQDLPITQKFREQDKTLPDSEDVTVVSVDESVIENEVTKDKEYEPATNEQLSPYFVDEKDHVYFNKDHKSSSEHRNYDILQNLKSMTSSAETQNKFAKAILIINALQLGLTDLQEVAAQTPKLKSVMDKQRTKLYETLNGIDVGVERALDRVASNVLNKIQKLEIKFENQWCKLENNGYEEQLKGLFYGCEDNNAAKVKSRNLRKKGYKKQQYEDTSLTRNSFSNENEKDNKLHSQPRNENNIQSIPLDIVNNKESANKMSSKTRKDERKVKEYKTNISTKKFQKSKDKKTFPPTKSSVMKEDKDFNDDGHYNEVYKTGKNYKTEQDYSTNIKDQNIYEAEKIVRQYLNENCKNVVQLETFPINDYKNIKYHLKNSNIKISKDVFYSIYSEQCKKLVGNIKIEESKRMPKDKLDNDNKKKQQKTRNVDLKSNSKPISESIYTIDDPNLVTSLQRKTRMFSSENATNNNNSNTNWFIKVGQARTNTRWSNHRSDWLFERASHRRNQPQPPPWLWGRQKNWFFRRAWARQQCRFNLVENHWCHIPPDGTITVTPTPINNS